MKKMPKVTTTKISLEKLVSLQNKTNKFKLNKFGRITIKICDKILQKYNMSDYNEIGTYLEKDKEIKEVIMYFSFKCDINDDDSDYIKKRKNEITTYRDFIELKITKKILKKYNISTFTPLKI